MKLEKGTFGIFPAKRLKGLKPSVQVVLCWIIFHANHEGKCWPSLKTLMEETGISSRTSLRKAIKEIENLGVLKIEQREDEKTGYLSNIYYIDTVSFYTPRSNSDPPLGQNLDTNQIHTEPNPNYISTITNVIVDEGEPSSHKLTFKKENYFKVFKAYEEKKGIQLKRNEAKPIYQTIKSMFLDGRTVEEILACMEFISSSEENHWQSWTLRTIKNQLPLFLAGKLRG